MRPSSLPRRFIGTGFFCAESVWLLVLFVGCGGPTVAAPVSAGKPGPTAAGGGPSTPGAPAREIALDPRRFRIIERESGDVNYYSVSESGPRAHIRARYRPPDKTAVLGYELDEATREHAIEVRWKWRAVKLPAGGDECTDGKGDSAAVVYLTWKRGLRYYTLKYVWSAGSKRGAVCASKRNPFVAQDTIVLESGPPLGEWKSESIDLARELRKHFFDNDPNAELPSFLGVAIMSDGDQTRSESAADYRDFVVVTRARSE